MDGMFAMISMVLEKLRKVEDNDLKTPEEFVLLKDVGLHNVNNIFRIHIPKSSSNHISFSDLLKQLSDFDFIGIKNLNYLFSNKSLIPEVCKEKTTLFLGTIAVDKDNRLWTPKLYYLPFHEEWRMGWFCLSIDRISCSCNIVLTSDNILNN
ncbi:MAG: hypothetical protein WCI91_03220 [Candidatus Nomurabacteria bacterium]